MTEAELVEAIRRMIGEANDVIGFRTLLDTDRYKATPVERIQFDGYIAGAGHGLALKVIELEKRLRREGIRP